MRSDGRSDELGKFVNPDSGMPGQFPGPTVNRTKNDCFHHSIRMVQFVNKLESNFEDLSKVNENM